MELVDQIDAPDEEDTLRQDLEAAMKEVNEKAEAEPIETAQAVKDRDESGKFKKADTPQVDKTVIASPEKASVAPPPNTWTAAAKAKWQELPSEIQAEIAKRESEVEKGFTKLDEERSVGKTFKETVLPYMAMIQAEGSTPIVAVQSLLNTAHQLRSGTPQSRGQLILQLAKQFNADISQTSSTQPQPDPTVLAIQQELQQLKNARHQEDLQKKQQEDAAVTRTIDTFAADPKNVHFETVKADMAALLQAGRAKDLQDAYDKAVWAHPDIRSTLLEQSVADKEAKRLADLKEKADKARKASVSMSGPPGATAPSKANHEDRSLREELEANFAAARGN